MLFQIRVKGLDRGDRKVGLAVPPQRQRWCLRDAVLCKRRARMVSIWSHGGHGQMISGMRHRKGELRSPAATSRQYLPGSYPALIT